MVVVVMLAAVAADRDTTALLAREAEGLVAAAAVERAARAATAAVSSLGHRNRRSRCHTHKYRIQRQGRHRCIHSSQRRGSY